MFIRSISSVFLIFSVGTAFGTDYWIGNNPDDLTAALLVVNPGDYINLNGTGDEIRLRGNFRFLRSGTPEAPIHLKSYGDNFKFIGQSGGAAGAIVISGNYWIFEDVITAQGYDYFPVKVMGNNNEFHNTRISGQRGFEVTGNHTKIIGGTINQTTYGIMLQGSSSYNLIENVVFDNVLDGIWIYQSPSHNIIKNITILSRKENPNGVGNGILFRGSSPQGARNNTIMESTFKTRGEFDYPPHIHIEAGMSDGRIIGNNFGGKSQNGILIEGDNFEFRDNLIVIVEGSAAFKIGDQSTGSIFSGNKAQFFNSDSDFCIFGNEDLHSNNTIVYNDNECVNGELTNLPVTEIH